MRIALFAVFLSLCLVSTSASAQTEPLPKPQAESEEYELLPYGTIPKRLETLYFFKCNDYLIASPDEPIQVRFRLKKDIVLPASRQKVEAGKNLVAFLRDIVVIADDTKVAPVLQILREGNYSARILRMKRAELEQSKCFIPKAERKQETHKTEHSFGRFIFPAPSIPQLFAVAKSWGIDKEYDESSFK